jgi:hypothetical protein|tara:strand:- start:136 stop:867 length:732 start_codon:yes stop_codon:yes gene_type:complete
MAKELEKKLLEELSRFKEINHNTQNLDEQMVGGVSSLGMGSHLERLSKRFNMDEQEVEDEVPTEEEPTAEPADNELEDTAVDTEIEGVDGGEESLDVGIEDTSGGDTKELDVTDLVTKQEEANTELSDQKDILAKNSESLDDLMNKLSDLESYLTSMDDMVQKIGNLENKIEEYRPRTPEEKLGLRKHDSGPYSQNLSDFFTDKEEVFDKTGKKQYILTKDEVEDFSQDDIKKSFSSPEEEEE